MFGAVATGGSVLESRAGPRWWWSFGRLPEAEDPALDQRDDHDQHGQDDRTRAAVAVVLVALRRVVQVDQRRPREGGVAEQVVELVERLVGAISSSSSTATEVARSCGKVM